MQRNEILKARFEKAVPTLMKNLEARGYEVFYCGNKEAARVQVLSLIPKGASVAWGGSLSNAECGIFSALREGDFNLLDRDKATTPEEKTALMKQALTCDVYLSSVNALSEDGIMINIDGNCNRIAAISYGPDSVILTVGMNKLCKTEEEALARARTLAAPANAVRLSTATPCAETGRCHDCASPACICSQIVTMRRCRDKGRIKVVLVGEELGL